MKIKHIMIISLLLVILTIGAISAADNVTDNALSTTTDDIVSLENDSQENIGDGERTFDDISATDWGGTLALSKDYKFGAEVMSPYGIYINKTMTIEGNNHTIDAAGQCNVFNIFPVKRDPAEHKLQ